MVAFPAFLYATGYHFTDPIALRHSLSAALLNILAFLIWSIIAFSLKQCQFFLPILH
jgi:hypothetical protein